MKDCWKKYRESFVNRSLLEQGRVEGLPVPGFMIRVLIPDFSGGYYVGVKYVSAEDWADLYLTLKTGSAVKGFELSRQLVSSEPEKIFDMPMILVISDIGLRHVNLAHTLSWLFHTYVSNTHGTTSLNTLTFASTIVSEGLVVDCPIRDPRIECRVLNTELYNSSSNPPAGWVNRVVKIVNGVPTGPDYNIASRAWYSISKTFSLLYVFPKTYFNKYSVIQDLSILTSQTVGLYTLAGATTIDYLLNTLYSIPPAVKYDWNDTLGNPGLSFNYNIPIGLVVTNNHNRIITFALEFVHARFESVKHGISLAGVPLLGTYSYKLNTTWDVILTLPTHQYQTDFFMIPAQLVYIGDMIAYAWSIWEDAGNYYAAATVTFIPGYRIEQLRESSIWEYRYPHPLNLTKQPIPEEYYQLDWSREFNTTYLNIQPGDSLVDSNNYYSAEESNPGLVANLIYQLVLMVIGGILGGAGGASAVASGETTSGASTLSTILIDAASLISFDMYYMKVSSVIIKLYTSNDEPSQIPVEISKETMNSNAYKYPPFKLVYWITVDPSYPNPSNI
ncbi:hypothetical protein ACSU1N_02885 [Thermogladius sp. 4427co]|uniref:hypothetical protein n=1 Tax=Thermogladius sp. 4427co TaxID=3450718 RepID=UPI003F7B0EEA